MLTTLLTFTLTLLTPLTGAAAIPSSDNTALTTRNTNASWTGRGQIRTLWNQGDHADLGCLTETGQWTSNDALCGTFTATEQPSYDLRMFKLSTSAGPCWIWGSQFKCEAGYTGYLDTFGIWPFPNSIPGVECLRFGQYGLMASHGRNPPLATDAPQDIHFVSYIETGKYVWLSWQPVR